MDQFIQIILVIYSGVKQAKVQKNIFSTIYWMRRKTILLSTNCTVNELAFELGFEYPQNLTDDYFKSKSSCSSKIPKNPVTKELII